MGDNTFTREFVESILKNYVILSIGTKGSGKTFLLLKYLKFALSNNIYDQYILVLPMFELEENKSYQFINANNPNIFIFSTYSEVITDNLIKQQIKEKRKRGRFYL